MANSFDVRFEDQEVKNLIDKLIRRVDNPRPLLEMIGQFLQDSTVKMFKKGGRRPDNNTVRGVKWSKLAESTIKQKRAQKKAGKAIETDRPLVRTGALRDDLASPRSIKVDNKGVTYGTDRRGGKKKYPYPGVHNVGAKTKYSTIPQRKWLFINTKELKQILHSTKDFLEGKLRKLRAK